MAAVEHMPQHPKVKGSSRATIASPLSKKMARKKALKHLANGSGRTHASTSQFQGFEPCHHCRHPERENARKKALKHLLNGSGRTHASTSQFQGFEPCHHCRHPERENARKKALKHLLPTTTFVGEGCCR